MKKILILSVLAAALFSGCQKRTEGPLIYKKFKGKDTFLIACSGNAKEGTRGIARFESAKRAALLNAYFFIRQTFDDSVRPETDSTVDRVERTGDTAIVHLIIRKWNLKRRLR